MFIWSAPEWFKGYGILFELLFAVITALISLAAFKVHRLTQQRQPRLFGYSFLFISLSYFLLSFLNFAIISNINQEICSALQINNLTALNNGESFLYTALWFIGLVTLAYMTLKVQSKKAFLLLLIVTLLAVEFASHQTVAFYLVTSILFGFVVVHYIYNYIRRRQTNTLIVLLAFLFLLFGSIHYLLAVNHAVFYVISNFLELIAYSLFLINLIRVGRT